MYHQVVHSIIGMTKESIRLLHHLWLTAHEEGECSEEERGKAKDLAVKNKTFLDRMAYGIWQNFSRCRKTSLTAWVLSRDLYMALPKSVTASQWGRGEDGREGDFISLSFLLSTQSLSLPSLDGCVNRQNHFPLIPTNFQVTLCFGVPFVMILRTSWRTMDPRASYNTKLFKLSSRRFFAA